MNILFVNPNAMPYAEQEVLLRKTSILRFPTFSMPIGLMDLAAYIRERIEVSSLGILDFGVPLYDFYLNRESREPTTVDQFLDAELDNIGFEPDIVGISLLFASSHQMCLEIARKAKERWPNCSVIFGGNQATNIFRELLRHPSIDYVFRGEAELALVEFIERYRRGEREFSIQGVYGKNQVDEVGYSSCKMLDDLKELPMPAFDLVNAEFYASTVGGSVMWTRGCPFRCTFCATTTVHGRDMRYKSNEQCLAEIQHLIDRYGIKSIFIEDDLFAAKKREFLELAEQLARIRGDCKFELPQGISVAVMDEDRIDAMLTMGIGQAAVAVESGSPYVQKHIMKKNVNLRKARELLAYMRKVGFRAHVNFILGSPGETDEMRRESIEYMKTLDANWLYIFHALPLPGSEMFGMFEQVADMRAVNWDTVRLGQRKFDTKDISAAALEELVYDTNIELNFFSNSNFRHGRYELSLEIWQDFILRPFPYHVVGRYCVALALRELGRLQEAEAELQKCVDWIKTNSESMRLFNRYKNRMPELSDRFRDEFMTAPNPVEYTKTLSGGRVIPGENPC